MAKQLLEVFDPQGAPLSCLWFGPVYFGTSRMKEVVLRNNAPQACNWVCLLQDTAAGTEVGTDAALMRMERCCQTTQDVSQVLVCVPNQGLLKAHEKTIVAVCFSPICKSSCEEKKKSDPSASRQDFCVSLLFDSVESRHGLIHHNGNSSVELAVTGYGLPVSLVPSPSQRFVFPNCVRGQCVDLQCVLQNLCPQLPVSYRFHKLAHFTTKPSTGTIAPGQCQDVVLVFTARQLGSFQVCLKLDVLDHAVRRDSNTAVTGLEPCSIHTVPLYLSAVCETTHPKPKLNPGILPAVTNPTGSPPVLSADKTRLHKHRKGRSQDTEGEESLAFPHDRATSIRPAHRQRRQPEKAEDDVDIGIVPSQGLVPPSLSVLESSKISETKPNCSSASPAGKCSCPQHMTSTTRQVNSQVMSAIPSTSQMVADCNRTLTAHELFQVVIGPLLVDFGEVCVQSVCVQKLKLTNHLPVFVWLQFEVDCPELQGSSPLSHVLQPHSLSTLPLTFQSNMLGRFDRPVSYSMNKQHRGRILVQAQVIPVALELSTTVLVLHPNHTLLAQSGYRSSVTLRNRRNLATEFKWRPVDTENGIMFSIRPSTGAVEPFSELDCEVVWYPSFSSSPEGDFDLCVQEGNTLRLHCVAKVAPASVRLAEEQVRFGSVPLNMPSIRTAVLHNTGKHHAFFQVQDVCPLPGMVVSPVEGVVPNGGQTTLRIHFNPDSVIRFSIRVEIALKNKKSIELRVDGSVEPPDVHISVHQFQFYEVYAGSRRSMPFALTNRSSAPASVTFDLTEHTDFSVHFSQPSKKKPGVNAVEVQSNQTVDCSIVFSPTHVDWYDFELPMIVNGVRWSDKSSLQSVTVATQQSHRVKAIVLGAPVEMSPSSLEFHVEPLALQSDANTKTVELKAVCKASFFWQSSVSKHVKWWLDCREIAVQTENRTEGELCIVSPSSGSLGPSQSISLTVSINPEVITTGFGRVTKLSLPLYLEDGKGREKEHQPYRELSITIALLHCITIHPPQIFLTPTPLGSEATTTVTLLASGYPSGTTVSAEVDEVELADGTKIQPVSIIFPEGNSIPAQNQDQSPRVGIQNQEPNVTSLTCSVAFCAALPLSLCTTITFTDHLHNRFKMKLRATADNCLLTVWPYMALHHSMHQIVYTGATPVLLRRYLTPSPAFGPASSSSSSSFDHISSTDKISDGDSASSQASRNTDVTPNRDTPTNLGFPEFPAADTEEGQYYQSVLLAVERWFSFFGWPRGPHPISVPNTLRVLPKVQMNPTRRQTYQASQNRDSRSVVDMLHHLTGIHIPGILVCQTFSTDINQRTNQQLQQHEAMLAFLSVQGACLGHIRPAYLLDTEEFKHSLQSNEEERGLDYSSVNYESLSKRSWTDVLLQIYRVLVLCRVSDSGSALNTTLNHDNETEILPFSSQSLVSNVYSSCECHLLRWLHMHYKSMRTIVWGTGGVPPERWIVNFDLDLTDGLVLAAVLAAYCPYLIHSHFRRMYTMISSLEQNLHNNIIVAQALTTLSLNLDVQPTDLSDPNPVQMLMLCVHLYERLPQFLPLETITLSGDLHSTFSKRVLLKNPSSKPIKYQVFLFGEDAHLFSLPGGSSVTIPSKVSAEVSVEVSCSFMQPVEAFLVLISSSPCGYYGRTLTFKLKTHVSRITPTNTVKCKSPCCKLEIIQVPVTNPFNKPAEFSVVLVESRFNPLKPENIDRLVGQASSKANIKMTADKSCGKDMDEKCSGINGKGSEFRSSVRNVHLTPGEVYTLNIFYRPICSGTKYCSVLLACPQVGDMVYMVEATAELLLHVPSHCQAQT
ncbi:cilia- and flagella-associated protein 47-like [Centropristis striata]|uniref:cilia- and flagella-associated protein 47-like n=1 Tax=Centropristis striata TaxID=184440 RepID=UPI0027E0A6ED|nr:cilia- and flagella-associated protein 47-like [Centropristis striata]